MMQRNSATISYMTNDVVEMEIQRDVVAHLQLYTPYTQILSTLLLLLDQCYAIMSLPMTKAQNLA